jgi:hypothetical protein
MPLHDGRDALDVVALVRSRPPQEETIVIPLDHAHVSGNLLVIEGCSTPDEVAHLTAFVCSAARAPRSRLAALVVATVRPGRPLGPDPVDHVQFALLREIGEDVGVDVLDWFVLCGPRSWSLAELTDAVPLWRRTR